MEDLAMLFLWINDGSGVWKWIPVEADITIGRGPENVLQVLDPIASSRHAWIQVRPDGLWLTDLGSLNGTYLMGNLVPARQAVYIQPGQEIRVGRYVLQVGTAAPMPFPPAPSSPLPPQAPPLYPPPPAFYPPAPGTAPQYYQQPPSSLPAMPVRKGRFPSRLVLLGGGVLLLVVALAVIFGVLLNLPDQSPETSNVSTGTPANLSSKQLPSMVALAEQGSTMVVVDGRVVKDANNVSISVSKGSVQGADHLRLVANQPPAAFDTQLEQDGWKRQSPLYTLSLDGEGENVGGAQLSFPANSPEDRLALLLDSRFVMPLEDIVPQDGRLTLQAFVQPGSGQPFVDGGGTHYFVIHPAQQTYAPGSLAPGVLLMAGQPFFKLQPGMAAPQAAGKMYCVTLRTRIYTNCYDAAPFKGGMPRLMVTAVMDLKAQPGMQAVLQQFIDITTGQLDAYNNDGKWFHQVPRQSRKMYIEISDQITDPGYNPKTGIIYIKTQDLMGMAANLSNQQSMAHEIFHWIEAQTYWMIRNSLSASSHWDMEMRAEVGSFLINPKFQVEQLKIKGSATDTEGYNRLGWQEPLFDWDVKQQGLGGGLPSMPDDERYIQAHIARMGLCPANAGKCIYSLQDFIDDVNNGTSSWNKAGFRQSLANVADYLLGYPSPYTEGVVDVNDPVLQNGWNYGDYIYASLGKPIEILKGTNTKVNDQTGEVTTHALVASGAIYPLRVNNGASAPTEQLAAKALERIPDVPYQLKIEAGIPFYYVISNQGGVQYSDGSKLMTFEPISSAPAVKMRNAAGKIEDTPGISNVRIVAANPSADDTVQFQASFSPMPPVIVADPQKISLKTIQDEAKLQVTVFQIGKSVSSFTALWDYGDGSPPERVKANPDANRKAVVAVKHVFNRVAVKEVRVTFLDEKDKPLPWDTAIIPVTLVASPTPEPISVTGWITVELSSASNKLIDKGFHSVIIPITWSNSTTFTRNGSIDSNYSVNGSISPTGLSMTINYPDLVGIKATCPHSITLSNIPRMADTWVFSTQALTNIGDIGPYMPKIETLIEKTDQCSKGAAGSTASSDSFFRVTFCKRQDCR